MIASIDRTNDKLVLTRKDTGSIAIDVQDTSGTLGAALKLAPGTTNAQTIGASAQVTVDGRTITSATNAVSNAIDGVTLNLMSQSSLGQTTTLTVGVNQAAISSAISEFMTSFNNLGDTLEQLTQSTPGSAGGTAGVSGPLSSDPQVRALFLQLRSTILAVSGTGTFNSLGSIGINTGTVGSIPGSTDRLQLDATKLTLALNQDAGRVAAILDGPTGPMQALITRLKNTQDPANPHAFIQAHTAGLTSEISATQRQELNRQTMIDNYQKMLEAQYASMEATLALLQAQSNQISAQIGSSTSSSSLGNSSS